MTSQSMVCGVHCWPGDANCNNYCNHDQSTPMADSPPTLQGEALRAVGVSRVADNDGVALVFFNRRPSDDELRALHDSLRR